MPLWDLDHTRDRRHRNRLGLLGVLLIGLSLVTLPDVTAAMRVPDLAGTYRVDGATAAGPYQGTATVAQKGRALFVRWTIESQTTPSVSATYLGFGLIKGSIVAVSYGAGVMDDQSIGGVAVFTVHGTRWVGEWPAPDGSIHTETWTKTTHAPAPVTEHVV